MHINDFLNISEFVEFKNQKKLKLENIDEINLFYNKYYNATFPVFYHCVPLYNTSINNNQFQYMTIEFDDYDIVLISYKIIQIMNNKQIRIFDVPISLNNNDNNINIVVDKLNLLSFVRFVFKESVSLFDKKSEILPYRDYYYDLQEFNIKFQNNKWLRQKRINTLVNHEDFKIIINNKANIDDACELKKMWQSKMVDITDKNMSKFKKMLSFLHDDIVHVQIYYKDKLISLETIYLYNDMAFDVSFIHIGRHKEDYIENETLHAVLNKIEDCSLYLIGTYLLNHNINHLFIAEANPKNLPLLHHKEKRTNGNCHKYYSNT